MAVWKLHYKEPYPQKPYLFFAAFCDQEAIDKLDESLPFPAALEIAALQASHFRAGAPWEALRRDRPAMAMAVEISPLAVVLQGHVKFHESLDYLRESIELLASLIDHGACGVYDPVSLRWYSGTEWEDLIHQGSLFNPFDHVNLLSTQETDGAWLRTRGMRKFGRPDISVREVAEADIEGVRKMLDRFINFQALGGIVEPNREVAMDGLNGTYLPGEPEGDFEEPEFKNYHIAIRRS